MIRRTLTTLIAIPALLLGGCLPRDPGTPDMGEWDGDRLQICDVPPEPPSGKAYGPKEGYIHILVTITADMYRSEQGPDDQSNPHCVPNIAIPFEIRLDSNVDGVRPTKPRAMPWTASLTTPHFEHMYVQRDTRLNRWEITVHAVHTEANVNPDKIPRSYIRCAIFVDGARVSLNSARIKLGLTTASCRAAGAIS